MKFNTALDKSKMATIKATAAFSDSQVRSASWFSSFIKCQPPRGENLGADAAKELVTVLMKAAVEWATVKTANEELKHGNGAVEKILSPALVTLSDTVGKPTVAMLLAWLTDKLHNSKASIIDLSGFVTAKDWPSLKTHWEDKQAETGFLANLSKGLRLYDDMLLLLKKHQKSFVTANFASTEQLAAFTVLRDDALLDCNTYMALLQAARIVFKVLPTKNTKSEVSASLREYNKSCEKQRVSLPCSVIPRAVEK